MSSVQRPTATTALVSLSHFCRVCTKLCFHLLDPFSPCTFQSRGWSEFSSRRVSCFQCASMVMKRDALSAVATCTGRAAIPRDARLLWGREGIFLKPPCPPTFRSAPCQSPGGHSPWSLFAMPLERGALTVIYRGRTRSSGSGQLDDTPTAPRAQERTLKDVEPARDGDGPCHRRAGRLGPRCVNASQTNVQ